MAGSKDEMNDLKDLQREAEELRRKRRRSGSEASSTDDEPQETETEFEEITDDETAADDESRRSKLDHELKGLAVHIDSVVKELETLARKQPSLALVSAFTAGFLAGKLFTRR